MLNLMKVEFKRVLKDKLFLIGMIVGVALMILQPIFMGILENEMDASDPSIQAMLESSFNALFYFHAAFNLTSNFGFFLPIFIIVIACRDFSYGTIRNKVIAGNSRASIYFSSFLVISIYMLACFFVCAFLSFGVAALFFKVNAFSATVFFQRIAIELMLCIFMAALIVFLANAMKSSGIAVLIYIALNFLFLIFSSILSLVVEWAKLQENFSPALLKLLETLNLVNPIANSSSLLVSTEVLAGKDFAIVMASTGLFIVALCFFGYQLFKKKNLK